MIVTARCVSWCVIVLFKVICIPCYISSDEKEIENTVGQGN